MIDVTVSTEIAAPAERVWSVLTDLRQFSAWNPFIRRARGSTNLGERVHVRVQPSLRIPLAFSATILACKPNKLLRWRGKMGLALLGSGDHTFAIEQISAGRVRFVQREAFRGLLPWLGARLVRREAARGFTAMNEALRARAEGGRP
jgi:hypothetical protein